jgi:hypothetical protein
VGVVDQVHLAGQEGRDERHLRDAGRGDGEVSGGVGSARGRVTAPALTDCAPWPPEIMLAEKDSDEV